MTTPNKILITYTLATKGMFTRLAKGLYPYLAKSFSPLPTDPISAKGFFLLLKTITIMVLPTFCHANEINFWNGNKTGARQTYELELLDLILKANEKEYGPYTIKSDSTDHPTFEGEANVFDNGSDVLVTIAGNIKFADKNKIVIRQGITKGLLGYRLLIIRDADKEQFASLMNAEDLQKLSIGIPATWVDAELFRQNNYKVVEKGVFDELFLLLKDTTFHYTALGANEIEEAFNNRAKPLGDLSIDQSIMLYYPFPVVFYVNGKNKTLAKRIEEGLTTVQENGEFDSLFTKHHGDIVKRLKLKERRIFTLKNPALPKDMTNFKASLLDG